MLEYNYIELPAAVGIEINIIYIMISQSRFTCV